MRAEYLLWPEKIELNQGVTHDLRWRKVCGMTERILVASVRHSGTRTLLSVIGLPHAKIRANGDIDSGGFDRDVAIAHLDQRTAQLVDMSCNMKTVIPLRHPAMIAVSWKKRDTSKYSDGSFLEQWQRIPEMVNPFFFGIKEMPFDDLEDYLQMSVNRKRFCIGSIGDYPEKSDLASAKRFLGDDWWMVEQAMDAEWYRCVA